MADFGIRVQLDLPELTLEEKSALFNLHKPETNVWVALKDIPLSAEELDIPEVIDKDTETKSPSQRLRAVLYRYWEQNQNKHKEFDIFYRKQMEKWINQIKAELQPDEFTYPTENDDGNEVPF